MKTGAHTLRHDAMLNALYHAALAAGAQAEREPRGLSWDDDMRPDLQIYFPGAQLLTDVVVSHPLAPAYVSDSVSTTNVGAARRGQRVKHKKYAVLAERIGARLLPFSVETCGGFAPDAVLLVKCMAKEAEEQATSMWSEDTIEKHVHEMLAMAIQRGNAMMYYRLRKGGQQKVKEVEK
jgi:hypothetical protein